MQALSFYDVIILGAGAAGLMCAAEAGKRGRRVLLLDKADKIGKKILISGGGRCNFTNLHTHPDCYLSRNPHFCKSALSRYTPYDFMALMQQHGLSWHEKTLGQLFCDQKSKAVVDMLWAECAAAGVELGLQTQIDAITRLDSRAGYDGSDGNHARFQLQSGQQQYQADALVIATGGPSIPKMGATDFGTHVAKQFGLKSVPFSPALVPFTFGQPMMTAEGLLADLSGVSVDVQAGCGAGCFRENMLITHRGLSGPAMLQVSSYWQPGQAIQINLLPELDIESWLTAQQQERPKAELKNILSTVLPKRLAQRLCEQWLPNPIMQQLDQAGLQRIAGLLQNWELSPEGTEGMRTAEVALGGVDTGELSSKTFEARQVAGLYFIGETVDVTGWLGGYNFQWAWASGWCAGQYA